MKATEQMNLPGHRHAKHGIGAPNVCHRLRTDCPFLFGYSFFFSKKRTPFGQPPSFLSLLLSMPFYRLHYRKYYPLHSTHSTLLQSQPHLILLDRSLFFLFQLSLVHIFLVSVPIRNFVIKTLSAWNNFVINTVSKNLATILPKLPWPLTNNSGWDLFFVFTPS